MSGYVALYYRLSLRDGDKKEQDASNSIENQKKLLRGFIQTHKELSGCEVLEFTDDGYSGTNFNRPDVIKMLDMVKQGKIETVVVKDLSRFGRNYVEVGKYLETVFPFLHVRFISVLDHFDSKYQTAVGDIGLGFKNIRSDYYSKWLSKRIKQTKRFRAKKGIILMPSFFGYKKNAETGELIIDEPAAEVVRFIYRERLAGKGMVEITKQLNASGTFTPSIRSQQLRGKPEEKIKRNIWYTSAVKEILTNRQYTGCSIFGKTQSIHYQCVKCSEKNWMVTENRHEAIISQEWFDEVQKTFYQRDTSRKRPADEFESIFVGKVVCGSCGKSYRKRTDGIYFCKSREYVETSKQCPNIRLKEFDLREMFIQELQHLLGRIQQVPHQNSNALKKEVRHTENEKKKINGNTVKLYEQFTNGSISKNEYLRRKRILDEEKSLLQEAADQQRNDIITVQKQCNFYDRLQQYVKTESCNLTKEIVHELVDCIIVHERNQVEFVWKHEDIYSKMVAGGMDQ